MLSNAGKERVRYVHSRSFKVNEYIDSFIYLNTQPKTK